MGKAHATLGYRHIVELEQRFTDEFGDDYEAARKVLERVVEILGEGSVA
jgi:ribosomal protein S17E